MSPLTTTGPRTEPHNDEAESAVEKSPPRTIVKPARIHRQAQTESNIYTDPDTSPVLKVRARAPSKSIQDLLASVSGLPGMSAPNEINEKRSSNQKWAGYGRAGRGMLDVADDKLKRRTTVS